MNFNNKDYTVETVTLEEGTIEFRAFRNRVYVDKPVNEEFQKMNIYAPETYYRGESINGYKLSTAPIFMPNMVGGYMPGGLEEPGCWKWGTEKKANTVFRALQHGYIVAVPAIRGRVQKNEAGTYTGKAPACVVDYKAAIRYIHYFSEEIPGDHNKIITNGTSAGGALSSLMGATGNHSDYEEYLEALGAADGSDEIFAASCYCPITNLEHADMAYEWQFQGIYTYHRSKMKMEEGGRPVFTSEDGEMSEEQIWAAKEEAKLFPAYINSLKLMDERGRVLELDEKGEGSFLEHMKGIVMASAQKAIDNGVDVSHKKWLTVENGRAVGMDWYGYTKDITRMKTTPAFDDLALNSPENDLFGTEAVYSQHFTDFSKANSTVEGNMADSKIVKMMNPMNYIEDEEAVKALHWRIRHGECDRDTSLAVSAILALKLEAVGCKVDYHSPWDVPHSGDYDLEELFDWIDNISKDREQLES